MSATRPAAAKSPAILAATAPNAWPKAVLISAVPPLMLKTDANPAGTPLKAFDDLRAAVQKDRSQFWRDLSMPFYGYNRAGAKVSGGVRQSFWLHLATRSAGRPLSANSGRGSLPSTCRFVW